MDVIFSEPVTASVADFTPGEVANVIGEGTASSFGISAVAGSGTTVITLTIAGTLNGGCTLS